ncbi:fibronectin type III domain-containing protein [Priestia megaterium]|uniref:Fibronectin type-III domain-containing protein n=1 Tax=Priestia megaterium TaxID=1404 RepID=A0A6M6DZT2_PRIMG|nr:fibronectin type III domain-containing protein [Priestia megaterium]QJX80403.1 hypothetical protein FDZ14_30415 [Priestia megaterium]
MTDYVIKQNRFKKRRKFIKKRYITALLAGMYFWAPGINVEASGSGTAEDPFLINSCEELQDVKNHLTSSYKLSENVDCSSVSAFEPFAELPTSVYSGNFDGNNFEIKNLTIKQDAKSASLFGVIDGKVSNLRLENVKIYGYNVSGPLATSTTENAVVDNVIVSGEVKSSGYHAGMIASNSGIIKNSHAYLNIESAGYIGGIAAVNNGVVTDSFSNSTTNQLGTSSQRNGGLVGYNSSAGTILNSYSRSIVKGVGLETGGLVGINYGIIKSSYSNSNITVSGSYAGGFSGSNVGLIESSYAKGSITNTGTTSKCTSGFTADNLSSTTLTGVIRNSFSHTTVNSSGDRVGSFVGCLEKSGADPVILNSYAKGKVTAIGTTKGGLIGYRKTSTGIVTNSFWDKNTTGMSTSPLGTGKTTAELTTKTTYTTLGWDFTDLWDMASGFNSGYPFFKNTLQTPPGLPSGFTVTSKTDRQINLAWDFTNKTTDYELWKDGFLIRQEPNTAYDVTNLEPNTNYQFKLVARNIEGDSIPAIINVKTRLSKPTGVTTAAGDSKIMVKWDKNNDSNISGYNVYRDDVKVNEDPISKEEAEYSVSQLNNYQKYKFTVAAIDTSGEESVMSKAVYDNPIDLTPPEKVTNISASTSDNSITLSWENPLEDFDTVLVYRGEQLLTKTTSEHYTDSNLSTSTNYSYKLVAQDPYGNMSEEVVYTARTKPETPFNIAAEANDKSILIKWSINDSTSVSGFNVYVDGGKQNQYVIPNSTKEFMVNGLRNNQPYTFKVTSIDNENESEPSNEISIAPIDTIPPNPVNNVRFINTEKSIELQWENPLTDFNSVLIYRGEDLIAETTGNTFVDANLESSQLYNYKIMAKDDSGNLSTPFLTSISTRPKIPKGLMGNLVGNNINLNWNKNEESNVKGYNIYINSKKWNAALINQPNQIIPILVTNYSSVFSIKLTAVNNIGGESEKTDPLMFTFTPPIAPSTPLPEKPIPKPQFPPLKKSEKPAPTGLKEPVRNWLLKPNVKVPVTIANLSKTSQEIRVEKPNIKEQPKVCVIREDKKIKCKKQDTDIIVSELKVNSNQLTFNVSSNKKGVLKINGLSNYIYKFDGSTPIKLNEKKLKPNKKYTVSITIEDHTEEFSFYTLANKPVNLNIKNIDANKVKISWDQNKNPQGTKYNLYINKKLVKENLATTSYVLDNKGFKKNYKIRVVALNTENKASEPLVREFEVTSNGIDAFSEKKSIFRDLTINIISVLLVIMVLAIVALTAKKLMKKKRP